MTPATSRRGFLAALTGSAVALTLPRAVREVRAATPATDAFTWHLGATLAYPALGIAQDDLVTVAVRTGSCTITANGRPVPPEWGLIQGAVETGALCPLIPAEVVRWPVTVSKRQAAREAFRRPLTREDRVILARIRSAVIERHSLGVWRRYRPLVTDWLRPMFAETSGRALRSDVGGAWAADMIAMFERGRRRHGYYRSLLSNNTYFVAGRVPAGVGL